MAAAAAAPEAIQREPEIEIELALPDLRVTMTRLQALDLVLQILGLLGIRRMEMDEKGNLRNL